MLHGISLSVTASRRHPLGTGGILFQDGQYLAALVFGPFVGSVTRSRARSGRGHDAVKHAIGAEGRLEPVVAVEVIRGAALGDSMDPAGSTAQTARIANAEPGIAGAVASPVAPATTPALYALVVLPLAPALALATPAAYAFDVAAAVLAEATAAPAATPIAAPATAAPAAFQPPQL
jgi:hypothetical protein